MPSYDLEKAATIQCELFPCLKFRLHLWMLTCAFLTYYLPKCLGKKLSYNVQGCRSKWTILAFLKANAAVGYYALNSANGDTIIVVLFTVPVMALAVRFIASIKNMNQREGKIPKGTGIVALRFPCYTEGADSLQGAIESLASNARSFSDKMGACLFIICDGLVVGKGNSKSTSEIVQVILETPLKKSYGIPYKELTGDTNTYDVFSGRFYNVPTIKIAKCITIEGKAFSSYTI